MAARAIASLGVPIMRANLDWAISEPEPGALSFDTLNDRRVARVEAAGLNLFPTLYVGVGWMNEGLQGGGPGESRSYPPNDLGSEWREPDGYSRSYAEFLQAFFSHYRGHFSFVAVENEAHSRRFWGGTAEEYVRLLHTAYRSVKAADPAITVVDSGPVSEALGLCLVQDKLETGAWDLDRATAFAVQYYSAQTGRIRIRTQADLEVARSHAATRAHCERIQTILRGMSGAVDAVNFHFYEDYRTLPAVVGWLREVTDRHGYQPMLVSNEIGVRGADVRFAESEAHAEEVFKKLVTSQTLGLEAIVWFSADTIQRGRDKVGLFGDEGASRPASEAFSLVMETLEGHTFQSTRASGPRLFHHVFKDPDGVDSVEALWTEGGAESVTLKAPTGRSEASVVDYKGRTYDLAAEAGLIRLEWVVEPVFVLWR